MCAPNEFIYDFIRNASSPENDMINGTTGEYMYLSVRTVQQETSYPWIHREGLNPSDDTLNAFRHLIQVCDPYWKLGRESSPSNTKSG